MAKPKVKIRKGKMTCPVCGHKISGQYGKQLKYVIFRKYECINPICGYAYYSEANRAMECIGTSRIDLDIDPSCLKPELDDLRKSIEKHLRKRNQLLREAREIVHDPEFHMIYECMERRSADIPGLNRAFLTWLQTQGKKKPARKFPNTIKSIKRRIAKYEDQQKNQTSVLDEGKHQRPGSSGP